jgi:MFS family permease
MFIPLILFYLIGGKIADVVGFHPSLMTVCMGFLLLSPFAAIAFRAKTMFSFLCGQFILAVLYGSYGGPFGARMVELFPPESRYTAVREYFAPLIMTGLY